MDEQNKNTERYSHVQTTPEDWSDANAPHAPRVNSGQAHTYSPSGRVYEFAQHEAKQNENPQGCASRTISLVLGLIIILIGIPMLICPGPGLLVITIGAGMVLAAFGMGKKGGTT